MSNKMFAINLFEFYNKNNRIIVGIVNVIYK